MTKINHKSRKGFTLIELLVVIGILAVLAAIAIPSVAGLIDRANVSTDNTNANEYTNAVERFTSEYELFKQDIASGTFDKNNMDAAQGRVYNVTGAETLEDIKKLESVEGLNGKRINIDTKYALNGDTARDIIRNYSKTSTSTFEPKQSDMTYWYNKIHGCTIVAPKNSTINELFQKLPSEYKGSNEILSITSWIDLANPVDMPDIEVIDVYTGNGYNEFNNSIHFEIKMPNPEKYPIDLSKIIWIGTKGDNTNFDINSREFYNNMQNMYTDFNVAATEDEIIVVVYFGMNGTMKEVPFNIKIAYEYEDNGETKYLYSPTVSFSYNELT